jgi:hypothetical protein
MEYHLLDQIVKSTFAFLPSSICKVANPTSPSCQLHIANLPSALNCLKCSSNCAELEFTSCSSSKWLMGEID